MSKAALKFLKEMMTSHGRVEAIVMDRLRAQSGVVLEGTEKRVCFKRKTVRTCLTVKKRCTHGILALEKSWRQSCRQP